MTGPSSFAQDYIRIGQEHAGPEQVRRCLKITGPRFVEQDYIPMNLTPVVPSVVRAPHSRNRAPGGKGAKACCTRLWHLCLVDAKVD